MTVKAPKFVCGARSWSCGHHRGVKSKRLRFRIPANGWAIKQDFTVHNDCCTNAKNAVICVTVIVNFQSTLL